MVLISSNVFDLNIDLDLYFIITAEAIAHVEAPKIFLIKASKPLIENGKAFMCTCANCSAIVHVHHFYIVEEILIWLQTAASLLS